jgi:UDP-N-acetylmuramoylalanine--D-glutamate ligase
VHLIAGGYDKGADLSEIASLSSRLGGLYGIGQTGHMISSGSNATNCKTVAEAVNEASKHLEIGDVLLLSPGCASWDQFTNFEERGRAFKEAVERSLGTLQD